MKKKPVIPDLLTPEIAKAKKYAYYQKGDTIRCVSQIDSLGVEYAIYGRRTIHRQRPRWHKVYEWWMVRYRLSKPAAWNRWEKGAIIVGGVPASTLEE